MDFSEFGFVGEDFSLFLASKLIPHEVIEFLSRELLDAYGVFKHVFRLHHCDKAHGRPGGGFMCESERCIR